MKILSLFKIRLGSIFHSSSKWETMWKRSQCYEVHYQMKMCRDPASSPCAGGTSQKKLQVSFSNHCNLRKGVFDILPVDMADFLHSGSMKQRLKGYLSGFLSFQKGSPSLWLVLLTFEHYKVSLLVLASATHGHGWPLLSLYSPTPNLLF